MKGIMIVHATGGKGGKSGSSKNEANGKAAKKSLRKKVSEFASKVRGNAAKTLQKFRGNRKG